MSFLYTVSTFTHFVYILGTFKSAPTKSDKKTIRARQIGGGGVGGMAHIRWCVLVFNLISLLWYWTDLMVALDNTSSLVIATKEPFILMLIVHIACIYVDLWVNNSLAKDYLLGMLNQLLIEIGCGIRKCISV